MNNQFLLPKIRAKKADLSVVVFVFLTLLLCVYTLYVINSSKNKIEYKLTGYGTAEELLLEQKDIEYRMMKLGEECIVSSFGPEATYLDYENWIQDRSEDNFTKMIKECLKEKSTTIRNNIDREKYILIYGIYSRISGEINSEINSNQEVVSIALGDFPISSTQYRPTLMANIPLNRMGLIHPTEFEKIVKCNQDRTCINSITKNLFNVEITSITIEDDKYEYIYNDYTFTSKKKFLTDGEIKEIKFTFRILKETKEK